MRRDQNENRQCARHAPSQALPLHKRPLTLRRRVFPEQELKHLAIRYRCESVQQARSGNNPPQVEMRTVVLRRTLLQLPSFLPLSTTRDMTPKCRRSRPRAELEPGLPTAQSKRLLMQCREPDVRCESLFDVCHGVSPTAIEQVVAQRLPSFYRTALRFVGNSGDAEDAVQEALLSAYKHL